MKRKLFSETVKSMKASEIIEAMIKGLENPVTDRVNMATYGNLNYLVERKKSRIECVGCAATNAIMKIAGINNSELHRKIMTEAFNFEFECERAALVNNDKKYENNYMRDDNREEINFIRDFEMSLDFLRRGNIVDYNEHAPKGVARIKTSISDLDNILHYLTTSEYKDRLDGYRELAAKEKALGN